MTTIVKIGFTFAAQLAYPVIIEISGQQGSQAQQLGACRVVEKGVFIILFVIPVFCIHLCIFLAPMGWVYWNRIFVWHPNWTLKKCAWHFIAINIACWSRKLFVQATLDIHKTSGVSFHLKTRHDYEVLWLPYLCCLVLKRRLPVKRTWIWKNTLKKEHFQFCTFMQWQWVCFLKSFKVLKRGNLNISCVAGKLTVSDSK